MFCSSSPSAATVWEDQNNLDSTPLLKNSSSTRLLDTSNLAQRNVDKSHEPGYTNGSTHLIELPIVKLSFEVALNVHQQQQLRDIFFKLVAQHSGLQPSTTSKLSVMLNSQIRSGRNDQSIYSVGYVLRYDATERQVCISNNSTWYVCVQRHGLRLCGVARTARELWKLCRAGLSILRPI